ncbi:DGQHR domain-containing protein [Vulgatibacter sp.]|uniref:DGQHR domain-containing protein n=1 Tax=Vulgatibacter sp. TaxID=1971226 RepID=UPI003562EB18
MVTPVLRVEQPLGEFFIASLPARVLQSVTYSAAAEKEAGEDSYGVRGGQRILDPKRAEAIGDFINGVDACFPSSIILAANSPPDGGSTNDSSRWFVDDTRPGCYELVIPSATPLARIVDGQHRVAGFSFAEPARLDMTMPCSIFVDLPLAYQAYLFATINFNQKKVDRSLAYELFGYSLDEEPAASWSPEKLAVFLARRLNADDASPFKNHLKVALVDREATPSGEWRVSMATVVDGLLSLFSRRPQADRNSLNGYESSKRRRSTLKDDGTPLRFLFLTGNDVVLYAVVLNFFAAVSKLFWVSEPGYAVRTVGIQAFFDIMRKLLEDFEHNRRASIAYFLDKLAPAAGVDLSDDFFQASGKGRVRIRNTLALRLGLLALKDLPQADRANYARLAG